MKHDKILSPLGTFIKYERKALGCTVIAFCQECGIAVKTYYRLIEKKSDST
jgi:transcriptional regulator with XRE-family HTH domain